MIDRNASLRRAPAPLDRWPATLPALLVTLALAACQPLTQTDSDLWTQAQEQRAESRSSAGRHGEAATVYFNLSRYARRAADRERYLILAAGEQRLAGNAAQARVTLEGINRPLAPENRQRYAETAAAIALDLDQPEQALRFLDEAPAAARGRAAAARLAIRAEALFRLGQTADATRALLEREIWLDSPAAISANQRRLWDAYLSFGGTPGSDAAAGVDDPVLAGWLRLGQVAQAHGTNARALRQALAQWQLAHPNHPALDPLVRTLLADLRALQAYPEQLALLLPLSGRQQAAGEAVREGFLAAFFALAGPDQALTVRTYDTSAVPAAAAYRRAVAEGADFIVGPLLKESVSEVAAGELPAGTLVLNYLPDDWPTPPGLYQFALAPEDEARQAAQRAVRQGQLRAIALAPDNDWGRRVLGSFDAELQAAGGRIIDYRFYDPGVADFSYGIEQLMLIGESRARAERLRANLGIPLEFEPRRRQDIDLIFMAASADAGKLIRPQLRFHYAGRVPTYATSAIYQEGSRGNSDLNGIIFPDIPWILAPDEEMKHVRAMMARYWPVQAERRPRLFALGFDAYRLIPLLHTGNENLRRNGATGNLYLDSSGRVHRELPFARIRAGQPAYIPPVASPERTGP